MTTVEDDVLRQLRRARRFGGTTPQAIAARANRHEASVRRALRQLDDAGVVRRLGAPIWDVGGPTRWELAKRPPRRRWNGFGLSYWRCQRCGAARRRPDAIYPDVRHGFSVRTADVAACRRCGDEGVPVCWGDPWEGYEDPDPAVQMVL